MSEFVYKNTKNTNINYTPFELNCHIYPRVFYKEGVNPHFKSKIAKQLAIEL